MSELIKRYKTTGTVSSRRKGRCERKSSLSDRDMRKIYSKSTSDSWLTARDVQTSVGGNSANLTVRTIRNYLRRLGRFTYRPANCPSLNSKQRGVRRKWAEDHKAWPKDQWRNVVFSDETAIELSSNQCETIVCRSKS